VCDIELEHVHGVQRDQALELMVRIHPFACGDADVYLCAQLSQELDTFRRVGSSNRTASGIRLLGQRSAQMRRIAVRALDQDVDVGPDSLPHRRHEARLDSALAAQLFPRDSERIELERVYPRFATSFACRAMAGVGGPSVPTVGVRTKREGDLSPSRLCTGCPRPFPRCPSRRFRSR